MKFIWEESDIEVGRKISKVGGGEVTMIGYIPANEDTHKYTLISLSDGMVTSINGCSKMDLTAILTDNDYIPSEILNLYLGV